MKNIIYILAIVSFLSGCDSNGFLEKIGLKEKISNVIQIRNDIAYLPNSEEPFTGRYETYYLNGQKKGEASYIDGKITGLATNWHENGTLQFCQKVVNSSNSKHKQPSGFPDIFLKTSLENG